MVEGIGWKSIQDRRYFAKLSLLYKIQHGLVDIESSCYLKPCHGRTRGQRRLFQKNQLRCPFQLVLPLNHHRDWNELPRCIKEACTLKDFQTILNRRPVHAIGSPARQITFKWIHYYARSFTRRKKGKNRPARKHKRNTRDDPKVLIVAL